MTRFYCRDTDSTSRPWWLGDSSGFPSNHLLSTSRGSATVDKTRSTVTGPATLMMERFATEPFSAGVTISGSISYNLWGFESAMTVNASFKVEAFRLQPDGTATSIGSHSNTSEFGTSAAVRTGSFTPTSTAFVAGDCLGFVVYAIDANGTMAAGTAHFSFDSPTASVDGDSYFTTTESISTSTTAPSGTTLYFTDTASDANPDANTEKKLQVGGSAPTSFDKVTNTAAGPVSPIQITDGAGGTALAWYTPQLSAVTIAAGLMELSLDAYASAASTFARLRANIYTTASDGSGATLIAAAQVNGNPTVASLYPSSASGDAAVVYSIPVASTALTDGQRLKVLLYIDDIGTDGTSKAAYGTTAESSTLQASRTVTFQFGSGGYLKLPTTVTELPTGTNAPAETASFSVAGVGATAKVAPQASTATVAFTAYDASVPHGTFAPATTATFSLSAVDATTKSSPTAGTASVTFAGVGATTKSSPTAQTAAVTFAGVAAAPSIKPNAGTATVSFAGVSATAKSSPTAGTATFTFAGVDAAPSTSISRTAGTATVSFSGVDATAKVAPTASTATAAFAGVNPSAAVAPPATTATFTLAGVDASAVTGTLANAQTATFSLSGVAATAKVSASATTAAMSFAAFGATVIDQPSAQTTTFSIAGVGATAKVAPTAQTAAFSFSGVNASVSTSLSRTAGTATFSLSGVDATVSTSGAASPVAQTATFSFSGVNATVAESPNAQTASFSFAGISASTSVKPNAGTASFTLAGVNATVSTAGTSSPIAGTALINFTAYDATVVTTGVPVPPEGRPGAIGKKRRQKSANEWHEMEAEAIRQRLAREAQQAPLDAIAEAVYDEVTTVPEPELAKVGWSWSRDEEEMLLLLT